MVNLTALNNLTNPEFNTTAINNSQELIHNMTNNANTTTDGYFGLIIMLLICIWLFYLMFKEDGFFRYDFIESVLISTGIITILGIVMILSDIISSWQHVMWFGIMFVIFVIAKFIVKEKT